MSTVEDTRDARRREEKLLAEILSLLPAWTGA